MSGRSGYGRSRIVGKLINLPANPNMAGLAPKVGKPGWAIRLYYQRVDECCGNSCEPIKIIRRIFVTGNSITDANLTGASNPSPAGQNATGFVANATVPAPITTATTESQAYYGIIYNRKIDMAPTDVNTPVTGSVIQLTQVDVAGTETPVATLNDNDFKTINASQIYGTIGTTFNINLGRQTVSAASPGYTNQNSTTTTGTPQSWDDVNKITATSVESRLFGTGGGSGTMAYIITNPEKIGGYGILFNITQILNASFFGLDNAGGTTPGVRGIKVEPPTVSNMQSFRKDVFAMTTTNNNISTTYTPGSLITTEDCFGATVAAPIGGFTIADTIGLPPLELLA